MAKESLRKKGKTGFIWSFMIQVGTRAITFVVSILLARILMPEEFGLIGMIAIFVSIGEALMNGGFLSSLIRTKDADNLDYSTVFFVNLITSVVVYILLFLLAPYIASFYDQEILVNLIRVLSLIIIINAFGLVQHAKLEKKLAFKLQFILQVPALIISALLSIWMAYNDYGVWSIVAKDVSFSILVTLQLWWYGKWVPSFSFDKDKFKYHFNFGYKLSLTEIINSSFNNLYIVVIGKYFSASQLGYFTRARSLEKLPSEFFYNGFMRVAYPLLAEISDDDEKLRRVYSQLMRIIVFIVTPILIYLGIVATPFFRWLLTEKWLPAVPYFQLLLISGVFYIIHRYNLNICKIKGRSDIVLKLSILQNALILMGAFTAIWYGIYGLLVSLIFTNVLVTFINAYFSGKLINYGLKRQIIDLYPIFLINSLLGLLFVFIQKKWAFDLPDLWNLIINGIGFFGFYFVLSYLFKLQVINDIFSFKNKRL